MDSFEAEKEIFVFDKWEEIPFTNESIQDTDFVYYKAVCKETVT